MAARIAIAVWNGRISPVFDLSRRLEVFDIEGGMIVARGEATLTTDDPFAKAEQLVAFEISTLVCGAVSAPLAGVLAARDIRVLPFVCGTAEEVLAAFLAGRLPDPALAMPGCCGRRRRRFGAGGCCGAEDGEVSVPECAARGPHAVRRLGASRKGPRGKG